MPKRLANTFLIFALLVIAVLSWQWLDEDTAVTTAQDNPVEMAANQTDYYLQDFKITNVNNDKGQVYELSGKTLSHFFETGNSLITDPLVRFYRDDNDYWIGSANKGDLSADFSVLTLSGAVDLAHHRENAQPQVSVVADSITIDTQRRQMTSDQPVQISSENWSFKANQMQAEVDSGLLSFNSGVEADYAIKN